MTSIILTVTGAQAQASVSGTLTSGMVGIPVTINYDDSWEGLTKNLVCRCCRGADSAEHRTILNVGSTAVVAHEVMKAGMLLYLGVEGHNADGTLVIPTIWAMCGVIQTGANTSEDLSADPTLPVWEQLQTEIEQIRRDTVTPEQLTGILSDIQSAVQASAIYAGQAEAAAKRAEEAAGPSQNGGLTSEQINALDGMFRVCAFVQEGIPTQYNAFRTAFNLNSSGGDAINLYSGQYLKSVNIESHAESGNVLTYTPTQNGASITYTIEGLEADKEYTIFVESTRTDGGAKYTQVSVNTGSAAVYDGKLVSLYPSWAGAGKNYATFTANGKTMYLWCVENGANVAGTTPTLTVYIYEGTLTEKP